MFIPAGGSYTFRFEDRPLSAICVWKYDSKTGEALPNCWFQVRYLSGNASGSGGAGKQERPVRVRHERRHCSCGKAQYNPCSAERKTEQHDIEIQRFPVRAKCRELVPQTRPHCSPLSSNPASLARCGTVPCAQYSNLLFIAYRMERPNGSAPMLPTCRSPDKEKIGRRTRWQANASRVR